MFYFIRHGQTDYSEQNIKIYQDFGVNLANLSETGIQQIKQTAKNPRLKDADLILSSPYTRVLQTAAILLKELNIEIKIETDLHECLANKTYHYETAKKAFREYPSQTQKPWENALSIKNRVLNALNRYTGDKSSRTF